MRLFGFTVARDVVPRAELEAAWRNYEDVASALPRLARELDYARKESLMRLQTIEALERDRG